MITSLEVLPPSTPVLSSRTSPKWQNYHLSPESLPSPPDVNSHAARRRRAGKLSQFFGKKGVDFSQPLETLPNTKKRSRETLDSIIGALRNSLQVEAKKGGMRRDEVGRLEDVITALRRRRECLGGWEEL